MYFSPTQKITTAIANVLSQKLRKEQAAIDLTPPTVRGKEYTFRANDVLIFGFPVYGGRLPKAGYAQPATQIVVFYW